MPFLKSVVFIWTISQSPFFSKAFQLRKRTETPFAQKSLAKTKNEGDGDRRRKFLDCGGLTLLGAAFAPNSCNAVAFYSSNARNMDRIISGDFSGGSVYDHNSKTEAGKKRRAMVGCKTESSRREASHQLNKPSLSEQECNRLLLGGETEFMLQALRKLDCPTCPYGIGATTK